MLLVACVGARVRADVTFPLGEHYRIGRYVPVVIHAPGEKTATLSAAGGVPVHVPGGTATAVPLLSVGTLSEVRLALDDQPAVESAQQLRPLRPDQRLVGVATDADDAGGLLRELFPAKAIVRAPLGRVDPLPGPAMAWTGLDALLLDPSTAARASLQQLTTLRAGGVAVAIRVDARPAGDWPWQRRGAWWVLPPDESLAVDVIQPGRYAPAAHAAGAPVKFRQVIVGALACFALLAIAASLWHSRRAWLVVIALSIVAAGAIVAWNIGQPTSASVGGGQDRTGPWLNQYVQYVGRAEGDVRDRIVPGTPLGWPVLYSPSHASNVSLTLECAADGTPRAFVARLKTGRSIAFAYRFYEPSSATPSTTPSPGPATAPATRTR